MGAGEPRHHADKPGSISGQRTTPWLWYQRAKLPWGIQWNDDSTHAAVDNRGCPFYVHGPENEETDRVFFYKFVRLVLVLKAMPSDQKLGTVYQFLRDQNESELGGSECILN